MKTDKYKTSHTFEPTSVWKNEMKFQKKKKEKKKKKKNATMQLSDD